MQLYDNIIHMLEERLRWESLTSFSTPFSKVDPKFMGGADNDESDDDELDGWMEFLRQNKLYWVPLLLSPRRSIRFQI